MVSSGFTRFGHLSFINQFKKKVQLVVGSSESDNKDCFIKTDTLYIGGKLYEVCPFL